tara:strand:+ start:737 stop:904 length:168 start_codon:yes stop_codon:yes gene_type:complete
MLYAFTKEEFNHLAEVVGSLAIDQFNGKQEPYREVIYTIFNSWVEAKENTNGTLD